MVFDVRLWLTTPIESCRIQLSNGVLGSKIDPKMTSDEQFEFRPLTVVFKWVHTVVPCKGPKQLLQPRLNSCLD